MTDIHDFVSKYDRFGQLVGTEVVSVGSGSAIARLEIKECHLNGGGVAHGGAIFTLADLAFAAAVNSHGRISVGASTNIVYVNPGLPGDVLTATATEINCGHKMASYDVRVTNQNDKLIAVFTGLAYRKTETLEELIRMQK